jgi:AcrR family transcriptional regulator
VEGACRIFFKKGYHPTTIRMIAKACGMSMGQLYHYISSKDDVLYLVHKHMQKVWYDYLKNSEMEKIGDPLQKLTEALHRTLEFMVENKKLLQFIYTESKYLDKRHLRIVLDLDYKNVIGFWRSLLKEVNKQKSIKGDSDFLGSLIAYLLVFLPLRGWTLGNKPTSKSVDSLVHFILRGLGLVQ